MMMVRISRPSTHSRWLRYPSGALYGVPPFLAFWVLPLMISVARFLE